MKSEDIAVELRLAEYEKVKAFADVTIPLGGDGVIKLSGWSVIHVTGKPAQPVPPARKGNQKYFEVVSLTGKIRSIVDEAILGEYEKQMKGKNE